MPLIIPHIKQTLIFSYTYTN